MIYWNKNTVSKQNFSLSSHVTHIPTDLQNLILKLIFQPKFFKYYDIQDNNLIKSMNKFLKYNENDINVDNINNIRNDIVSIVNTGKFNQLCRYWRLKLPFSHNINDFLIKNPKRNYFNISRINEIFSNDYQLSPKDIFKIYQHTTNLQVEQITLSEIKKRAQLSQSLRLDGTESIDLGGPMSISNSNFLV